MAPIARLTSGFLKKRIEKLRNVFLIAFLFLILTIISTPLLVRGGFSFVGEEVLEAILLLVQVSIAWNIFRLYEEAVRKREKEIDKLEREYGAREKELLETFTYLGKVNVQMSLLKNFLQKLKAPATKSEVKENIHEILKMALAISKKKWITIRIIYPNGLKTVSEFSAHSAPDEKRNDIKIGNREIVEMTRQDKYCREGEYCVISSAGKNTLGFKAFLVFENNNVDEDVLGFLSAAVNQCEIIYTLFEARS